MFKMFIGCVAGAILTIGLYGAAAKPTNNALLLGDRAPNFKAMSSQGELDFYRWAGDDWVVFFSHPKAFTPVCTTELGVLAMMQKQFAERGAKVLALSVDTAQAQAKWIEDINSMQNSRVGYPLIADSDRKVSALYGMIREQSQEEFTVRSVFIIDPNKRVRLMMTYPASTGRNYGEILRALDSLQLTDSVQVATPANWQKGDEVAVRADVDREKEKTLFPKGVRNILSYLRLTFL